ncbi:DUF4190 domain-containing protein [Bacillus infantis]|uniref:DUF4190 domain-containing protein n=1 Tax=Bacillus infantis TaxID=324767 RepID=A0A5D4SFS0_9BACI|nr:DUF4190 domain-containing protein [Bacillus infantis]TYS61969.1 DUF4190 domain-containing protein [Bacillus infantis]
MQQKETKSTNVAETQKDRSSLAITSLVLGITSALFFLLGAILLIFDIVASVQYSNTVASLYYEKDDTAAIVGITCFHYFRIDRSNCLSYGGKSKKNV